MSTVPGETPPEPAQQGPVVSRQLVRVRERDVVEYERLAALKDTIKAVVAPEADDDELEFFFRVCERVQLDPFKRQMYLIPRYDRRLRRRVHQPQTSIEGFRAIAERSGLYAGQVGPFWCGGDKFTEDGKAIWTDVWLRTTPPAAAKIGILRKDFAEPLWQTVSWNEYKQEKDGELLGMWKTMPANQLSIRAEAAALRRAFPEEIGGLYTVDEIPSEYAGGLTMQEDLAESFGLEFEEEAGMVVQPPEPELREPWQDFDTANVTDIKKQLAGIDDVEHLRGIAVYESNRKNRTAVNAAIAKRIEELASKPGRDDTGGEQVGGDGGGPGDSTAQPGPPAPEPKPEPQPEHEGELTPQQELDRALDYTAEHYPETGKTWDKSVVVTQANAIWQESYDSIADFTDEEATMILNTLYSKFPGVKEAIGG